MGCRVICLLGNTALLNRAHHARMYTIVFLLYQVVLLISGISDAIRAYFAMMIAQ